MINCKPMSGLTGKISQVIGPVVDVHFDILDGQELQLPAIHDALKIRTKFGKDLIVEVQQHIGEDTVRTVAMDSTDGLRRGLEAVCTGGPISMPVGGQIRGRVLNVTGDAIDGISELDRSGHTAATRYHAHPYLCGRTGVPQSRDRQCRSSERVSIGYCLPYNIKERD